MTIRRVTILEFAPTADEIWRISQHSRDGYAHYNAENGLVSILDTAHEAKLRPEVLAIYAGGKATNVARVLDRLLPNESDAPQVELVTFLPPPDVSLRELRFLNSISLRPSTPAGIYVQCLQISNLRKVKPRFEIVDELEETGRMQTTRRCIEITLRETSASLNFSPSIVWSQEAADAVMTRIAKVIQGSNLVVIAGAPPVWDIRPAVHLTPYNFYAKIIDVTDPDCLVSVDASGRYLHECLIAKKSPRFIFINTHEFYEAKESWKELGGKKFPGTLLVHDKEGCWVWDGNLPDGQNPFSQTKHFPSLKVPRVYSTIGAGDAMHAGFLKEWIFSEHDKEQLRRAIVYSQVVAAISVSNEKATHGIDIRTVENEFQRVWR